MSVMTSGSFDNRCRPSCSRQVQPLGQNSHQAPRDREYEDQLSQMGMHRSSVKTSRVLSYLLVFSFTVESSCVCLHCCGPARVCSLQGVDCQGRQVFYFERPLRVDACCLGCCLMEIRAYLPQKRIIGTVCQRWSMFTPLLEVCDSEGSSTIRIQGSCCPGRCFSESRIVSSIGGPIGSIWKKWPGFNEEHNMDHDCFGLEVQSTLESHNKLLLLEVTFLLVSRSSLQYFI
uniref:Phospholipid scramblase n=1 Tax=Oryzias latipes TaxID=8090 RepID=A0A3P9JH33_ORYLA